MNMRTFCDVIHKSGTMLYSLNKKKTMNFGKEKFKILPYFSEIILTNEYHI